VRGEKKTCHFFIKLGDKKLGSMYQQKNKLKDLIYIQENKPCNEQTVNGLFRSIVEPILEQNLEGIVLCRLEEKSKETFRGILKRLEYSNSKVYDFSDKPISENFQSVLKDNIWGKTEFVYVLAPRFGAVLIFDYEETDMNGLAQIYLLHNSKNLSDAFEAINANSKIDLIEYQNTMHPDRRDNDTLNSSIRKIVENLNETNQEIMISEMTKEPDVCDKDLASRMDFLLTKSSYIVHEIRNMLSICNLYSEIIEKQSNKIKFENEEVEASINNARACIRKSIKMAGNLLLDLKSLKNADLKEYDLKTLTQQAVSLTQGYALGKEIEFKVEIPQTVGILADEHKFLAVLINLIKNAVESIEEKGHIIVKTDVSGENVKITISNDGSPIRKDIQEKLFEGGVTTKASGTGLGLVICKKNLEEQFAQLRLTKSDEDSTEFEITVLKA